MSFVNLPLAWIAAGLVGLAGGLYALHWLRVRYREVAVITTMFWREALQEAPARVFRQRFRHLPAYLLILAICALMWLALAGPEWRSKQRSNHYVLLLDGSAGMARGDRFAEAVAALDRDANRLDKNTREVWWVGAGLQTLLAPGEESVLLDKRLQHLKPQPAPSGLDQALRQLASIERPGEKTVLRIYGDSPVSAQVLKLLPKSHVVVRATEVPKAANDEANAGITSLGLADAASGRWNKVDALVRAESTAGGTVDLHRLAIMLDGKPVAGLKAEPAANGAYLLKDLPASGGLLQVRLTEKDALALDDEASVRLPRRPLIRVQLSPSLQSTLGSVLAADSAIERTNENPDVVIRREGEKVGEGRPALVFVPMAAQPAAFSLTWPDEPGVTGEDARTRLAGTVRSLGLGQIDATALAQVAQRPIEIAVQPGASRGFSVWQELLLDDYNFTRSRTFPLFIAESVRWLARTPAWYPYVAAGQPLPQSYGTERAAFVTPQARAIDTLGSPFVPQQAGDLPDASRTQPLHAALLDRSTTLRRNSSVNALGKPGPISLGRAIDPVTLLLLLALALLSLEWVLYRRGRLP